VDLYKAIRELHEEKRRLEETIASLEDLIEAKGNAESVDLEDFRRLKRRGRKTMSPEERREVSERMKRYWARHRASPARPSGRTQS
jgi:hypothetical protein